MLDHGVWTVLVLVVATLTARRTTAGDALAPLLAFARAGAADRLLTARSGGDSGDQDGSAAPESNGAGSEGDPPRLEVLKERVQVLARLIGDSRGSDPPR